MKAVRIHAKQDIRVEDIVEPTVEPGKVLLRGGYTGICGSDLHLYYAPESFPWDFSTPAKLTGARWPQILGHEFSGQVAAIGEGVGNVQVGDNVTVFPYHHCGECAACRAGDPTACPFMAFEGIQGQSGGMAEVKIVDAGDCLVLPESLDLRHGALVEPMAVAWRGVAFANPDPEKAALVIGAGPIGLGAYFALKGRGVRTIIVSEPSAGRRAVLERLGVEHIVDPSADDLGNRVRAVTDGAGVAVALDCAGVPAAFGEAMRALGLHGRMVIVAAYEQPIELDPAMLHGGKSIRSSTTYTREDFAAVIQAMEKQLYRMDGGWIDTIGFDGVVEAINELRAGKRMKVLVQTPVSQDSP